MEGVQSFRGEHFFDKPLQVTEEEAEGIIKFADALKPGIYLKCDGCKKFKHTEAATLYLGMSAVSCERCGRCLRTL